MDIQCVGQGTQIRLHQYGGTLVSPDIVLASSPGSSPNILLAWLLKNLVLQDTRHGGVTYNPNDLKG